MSLTKPRILCLHGGGVSARIFEVQMRAFIKSLENDFRLVFADAPWPCDIHYDLKPVYSDMGPCYRWADWEDHHRSTDDNTVAVREVERCMTDAMEADVGTGPWVGLLGFSQGAKLAFSILLENQLRTERQSGPGSGAAFFGGIQWKFGVILAGRAPPFSLHPSTLGNEHFADLTKPLGDYDRCILSDDPFPSRLKAPTLHVHGLKDHGLEMHRDLLAYFPEKNTTRLVEWDGTHRVPFRGADVERITQAILEMTKVSEWPRVTRVFL